MTLADGKRRDQDTAVPAKGIRRRQRMSAEAREEFILRIATTYFAENGLGGGTIELARRAGITQPLLYKYFATKEALIDRVYERLFPKNWNPDWETLLEDRSLPVRDRLKKFYREYSQTVLTYEHVRLFLFSGLSSGIYNSRYYGILSERILKRIVLALRHEYGDPRSSSPVSEDELELVQSLHAAVYHVAFRKWVHSENLHFDLDEIIGKKVDFCLDGAERAFRWLPGRNSGSDVAASGGEAIDR